MNELISLKEVDKPHVFHSHLTMPNKLSRFCVLAENSFIIFKKSSDVMSLYRIPLNKSTGLEFLVNEFSICYGEFKFSFSHSESDIILQWNYFLNKASKENIKENFVNFYAEVVQIDKFKGSECPIIISKTGWKLFIYESYEYQRSEICSHVINLEYYSVAILESKETLLRSSTMILIIKGFLMEFKLTFNEPKSALEWCDILRCSKENYLKSLTEKSILSEIYENKSNKFCADCGLSNPEWVSINFCITLCENCVGIHRKLSTMISRTQSIIMDDKCWNDSLLVELLKAIGNENANNFWCKSSSVEKSLLAMVNIERKYKNKDFIDETFLNLSSDDIFERLSASVRTSDLVLTMRLWFSNKDPYGREMHEILMKYAERSQQILQHKFLSLQVNVIQLLSSDNIYVAPVFEGIYKLSYDKLERNTNFYLISLFNDRISIKAEDPDLIQKDTVDICTIYLSYITMVRFDSSKNVIQLSFYPQCKFLKITVDRLRTVSYVNINRLSIDYNSSKPFINDLKLLLLDFLLPQIFEPPSKNTSLFSLIDIQINKEPIVQCKCHVTNHEFVVGNPINVKYDMSSAQNIILDTDKSGISVNLPHCDIMILSRDCQEILYSVQEASEVLFLSLSRDQTVIRLEELIDFIKFHGLNSEKIFEKDGDSIKMERLFVQIVDAKTEFSVHSKEYSVDDVAMCLKKCLSSLNEPMITEEVMLKLISNLTRDNFVESCTVAMGLLPPNNYRILRHLIELLFLIVKRAKYNEMNSYTLSETIAAFLIDSNNDDPNVGCIILRHLIDNFETVFNYSDKEKDLVGKFLNNLDNPLKIIISRQFNIDLSLKYLFLATKFILVEYKKLDIVGDNKVYMYVTMRIDHCTTVGDITAEIFDGAEKQKINLWLYIYVKNKVCKRLLYCNESTNEVIVNRPPMPALLPTDKVMEMFVFTPAEKPRSVIGTLYRCEVKMAGRKCELMVSLPVSLKIYDLESECENATYDLKISDISIYRSHGSSPWNMHILTGDKKIITCEFKKQIEFQEFLLHFDTFSLKSIAFKSD